MGTVKAVIGYGIGLAVFGIILTYMIRAYLRSSKDHVARMARRDSTRRELRVSADYARTFLGATVHPGNYVVSGVGRGSSADSDDNGSDQRPQLTLLDPPPTPVDPPPAGDGFMTITVAPSED